MFLTGCVSSLSAQQSFWKEDFSAGKLPDGWMIVDSTKSAKCEWIVTDQPYPGSFQFERNKHLPSHLRAVAIICNSGRA